MDAGYDVMLSNSRGPETLRDLVEKLGPRARAATATDLLQAHLADAHVVKGFNNIYVDHLATLGRPTGDPDRSTLAIAGDDDAAKQTVVQPPLPTCCRSLSMQRGATATRDRGRRL